MVRPKPQEAVRITHNSVLSITGGWLLISMSLLGRRSVGTYGGKLALL